MAATARSVRREWMKTIAVLLVVIGFFFLVSLIKRESEKPDPGEAKVQALKQSLWTYYLSKPRNEWWLLDVPKDDTHEATFAALTAMKERIARLIATYGHVSPLTAEVAQAFPEFHLSIFTNGASVLLMRHGTMPPAGSFELCFVPRSQAGFGHLYPLYYFQPWHAVVLFAIQFPDSMLAASLFHELGHALRGKQGRSTAGEVESDAYVDEEIEMHRMGEGVLDAATKGAFRAAIATIASRDPRTLDYRAVILALTRADFQALDCAVGTEGGVMLSRILLANYLTAVGFAVIERFPAEKRHRERCALYRWLRSSFMSKV